MSKFSETLRRLTAEKDLGQSQLAYLSGMKRMQVYRLLTLNGRPTPEQLAGLCAAFDDAVDRYQLMRAHMQDELPPREFKRMNLEPGVNLRKQLPPLPSLDNMPQSLRHSLRFLIARYEEMPVIGEIICSLASFGGALPDSRTANERSALRTIKRALHLHRMPPSKKPRVRNTKATTPTT